MKADHLLDRIVIDPPRHGRQADHSRHAADGGIYPQLDGPRRAEAEILTEYDVLTRADIQACLLFAAQSLQSTLFMPLTVEPA